MPDWSTYSPENFLMFSARTYHRLFERHHHALWPAQLAALAAGIAILVLLVRDESRSRRYATGLVAAAWLAVAWTFLWTRFSTIHLGGRAMAIAFGAQAALLGWASLRRRQPGARASAATARAVRRVGWAVVAFAVAIEPLVGRLLGRPWAQAELFAVTPDATVAATVGVLLATPRSAWYLWPVPVAWSLFSGMTLFALPSPEWWLLPAIALGGVVLEGVRRRRSRRMPAESREADES